MKEWRSIFDIWQKFKFEKLSQIINVSRKRDLENENFERMEWKEDCLQLRCIFDFQERMEGLGI